MINQIASPTIQGESVLCLGEATLLSVPAGLGVYQWSRNGVDVPGAASNTFLVNAPGSYLMTVNGSTPCSATSNTFTVQFQSVSIPDLNYEGNVTMKDGVLTFCEGSAVRLFDRNQNMNYTYRWYKDDREAAGQNYKELIIHESGSYNLEISNGECKSRSDQLIFKSVTYPALLLETEERIICQGSNIEIGTPAEGGVNYLWNDGTTSSKRIVNQPGSYHLTASRDACSIEGVINTKLNDTLLIPNIITPGNDEKNECFIIDGISENAELHIYNRWGKLVHASASYNNDWNGDGLTTGVYFYSLQNGDQCHTNYKGWIDLIR